MILNEAQMRNKSGLFIIKKARTVLMADLAQELKHQEVIGKAYALSVGTPRLSKFWNYTEGFDETFFYEDIYVPNLIGLSANRTDYLLRTYDSTNFLWNFAFSERGLFNIEHDTIKPMKLSEESIRALILKALHYADQIVFDLKPAFIFDTSPLGLLRQCVCSAAKKHDVPYMYLGYSKIGNLYTLYDDLYESHKNIQSRYYELKSKTLNQAQAEQVHQAIKIFFQEGTLYSGHTGTKRVKHYNTNNKNIWKITERNIRHSMTGMRRTLRQFRGAVASMCKNHRIRVYWRKNNIRNYRDFHTLDGFRLGERSKKLLRRFINFRVIQSDTVDAKTMSESHKLLLYTWHLQPEASTSQSASFYVNQDIVIQNIARVLPLDWLLLVKPYKATLNTIRTREYRLIKSLPNVAFADYGVTTGDLLEHCSAVVTLTGTVGLESLICGKPAFYFGKPSWRLCNSGRLVKSYEELGTELRRLDQNLPNKDDVMAYLHAIIDHSAPLEEGQNMRHLPHKLQGTEKYENNIANIVNLIKNRIYLAQ